MTFRCDICGQNRDFDLDFGMTIVSGKGVLTRICRRCKRPKGGIPDVYWDGKPEENLADDPQTGMPRVFSSKAEKAAYLKSRGLMEAGDRVHGAPMSVTQMVERPSHQKTDSREIVRKALADVKKMGIDYRRREFLRIKKQGERYA